MSNFVTRWTADRLAPLSMRIRQAEYQRGLPYPPLGDLPDPGIEPTGDIRDSFNPIKIDTGNKTYNDKSSIF